MRRQTRAIALCHSGGALDQEKSRISTENRPNEGRAVARARNQEKSRISTEIWPNEGRNVATED
jgi:hypothetical protein